MNPTWRDILAGTFASLIALAGLVAFVGGGAAFIYAAFLR